MYVTNPNKKKNVTVPQNAQGGGYQKIPEPQVQNNVQNPTAAQTTPAAPAATQTATQPAASIQIDDLVNEVLNRPGFSFDMDSEALYQQYADQYSRMGQMAMQDTMGQAQAMTGGYGNSYAQTAGQQTYQNYMQGLNEAIPDLYQMALDRYMMEGDLLMDKYALMADREAIAEEQRRYDQEWNEEQRRWAAEHPELVSGSGSGGGGGSGTNTGNPGGNPQTQNPTALQIGEVTDTQPVFDGSTYSQAVEYMEANGVSSAEASGVMTESEWNRRKNSYQKYGTGGAEVTNYDSYKEYLADYVEYKVSTSGGTGGSDGKKGGNGGR
jgi:hypothetical protein